MKNIVAIALLLSTSMQLYGQSLDSLHRYSLSVTPRLNSVGYFPFTGAILNRNKNFDVNIVFQRGSYGFLAFKSFDLEDKKTDINYLQSAVFRQFTISGSLKTIVYAGYLFAQTQSFSDKNGSDYFGAWSISWDVNEDFRVENIALLTDVSTQSRIVNRLQAIYTIRKFKLTASVHQRQVVGARDYSASAAATLSLPKINITKRIGVQFSVMYQGYITKNRPGFALQDGFLFSLALPLDLNN